MYASYPYNLNSKDPARQSSPISPVPLTKVPDLKEISAVGVAISLWKHINVPVEAWKLNTSGSTWCPVNLPRLTSKITDLTVELPVPKLIVDYINTFVNKICFQIEDWVSYHHVMIFFGDGSNFHLYHHIPYFVWYLDGTINYKETARNLLFSLRLSDIEKYKFLCTYCLEDEMTTLVPSLIMDDVFELVSFNYHPLIFYWNLYFKNTLQKIPLQANLTLDNQMFRLDRVNNWWAKEYFFNRLNPLDKVQGAITLIDRFGVWYQKLILMKLSESERINLYTQKGAKILSNYSKTSICGNEILSTWYDICDLISADQFVSIFEELLGSRNPDSILAEIWTTSSDHFKYYLSTYNNHQIIGKIFTAQKTKINFETDNKLLFVILSDLNVDVRRSITKMHFFTEYCDKLFEKHQLSIFERLIRMCLPIQELDQFRRNLIFTTSSSIVNICHEYYLYGNVQLLNNFLTQLFPSRPDLVLEYKKFLLCSTNTYQFFARSLETVTNVLDVIMADSLLTEDLQNDLKKRIIFLPHSINVLQSWLVNNSLFQVKTYVDYYLTSDQDKKSLKKRLLIDFENNLATMFNKYDLNDIQFTLNWCLDDGEGLQQYKSALQVDTMFNTLLKHAIFLRFNSSRLSACAFRKQFEFGRLDAFLTWYFLTPCRVKEYKLLRINSYSGIPVITSLLRKKDERHLKLVMSWFFDGDQKEIEEFKKKHGKAGKIAYVI